jgi:lincosamide nucleotidyltransferase
VSGDLYDRLLERLTEAVQDDPRIEGLLLYGSRARGEADAWSDMDVGVVTADSAADEVVRDRATLIRQVGEPLFLEDFGNPANVHVILADGVAFELIVRPVGELVEDGPHRLVLDKHGQLAAALSRKAAKGPRAAADEAVHQLIHYFWHEVEHVVTALGRGQLLWAHGGLEAMRGICLRLARLSAGLPPEDDEPYWKVDGGLDPTLRERLLQTIVPAELPAMSQAAGELLEIYRSLARPLAERHALAYPERLDALVSARLPS